MKRIVVLLVVALALVSITAAVRAQPDAIYNLTWWTVDGGGMSSVGGGYSLSATIGQPDAASSAGPGYSLQGGFWGGLGSVFFKNYLPTMVR